MSTELILQIESTSLEDTLSVAEKIGRQLHGGEVIELLSDLGGGKTAFVRGLAKGMGSSDGVSSPSFTLSNEYRAGELTLYHFDFYRLHEAGIMKNELAECIEDPHGVVAVEWGEIVEDVLPADRLTIRITATDEQTRHIEIGYPKQREYLFEANT